MPSVNDVTGDALSNVKGNTELYSNGWDAIWGKPKATITSQPRKESKKQIQKRIDDLMDQMDALGKQSDVLMAEIEKLEELL